ncbi:MAG: type II secretion system protein [Planctomycetota bacterium]|jgi:prepilin-type N-terminal cleavage/methylation domain-containing protein
MKRKTDKKRWGFTLVELLTTLAVIGVLLGLLIPALNQVTKKATQVKQKAQFHAIGNALEAFRNDYGDYPPSAYNPLITTDIATASHNLAEALVGRDGLGFHPASQFRGDGLADVNGDGTPDIIYGDPSTYVAQTPAQNLASRKGPYLELESANAVKLSSIAPAFIPALADSYVLVDMYKILKNSATSKEVGMPILYYRANRLKIGNSANPADWDMANTYSINDSFCNSLGIIKPGSGHYGDDVPTNASIFYNAIQNPNFTSPPRPYRAESFILQSAGPDGLYGTMDDIFNFDQNN